MVSLFFADSGAFYRVKRINGQGQLRRRLAEMGIVCGSDIFVISSYGGDVILRVGQTKVALGGRLSQKIMV